MWGILITYSKYLHLHWYIIYCITESKAPCKPKASPMCQGAVDMGIFSHGALGNGMRNVLKAGRPCEEGRESEERSPGSPWAPSAGLWLSWTLGCTQMEWMKMSKNFLTHPQQFYSRDEMTLRGSSCVSYTNYPLSNGLERILYIWGMVVNDMGKSEEIMSSTRIRFDYRKHKYKTIMAYTTWMLIYTSKEAQRWVVRGCLVAL